MPTRAGMRAPPLAAVAGRRWCRARVRVRVPYPAWFFLNPVSRVWVAPLPEPDPLRSATQTARSPTDPNRPPTDV